MVSYWQMRYEAWKTSLVRTLLTFVSGLGCNGRMTNTIVSADAHILEPPDIWAYWLPARYQDKAPQLAKDADGGDAWLFAGAAEADPIGLTATPGMPWDQFRWTGVTYDEARDATSIPLITRALERGIPVFAICRGIQELNVALGGSLATEIQEGEGRMDHRAPESTEQNERFAIRHPVTVAPGSCLANALGETETVRVNSLHRQAIDRLGNGLVAEAVADDGTIEAVSVKDAKAFAIGVQWHPEYWHREDNVSRHLFQAFGEAVRAHAQARES